MNTTMTDSSKVQEVSLPIEGMECAACAVRLERQLNRPGSVSSASVNFATAEATVTFDPASCSIPDLTQIVEKSGFSVARKREESEDGISGDPLYDGARRRFIFAAVLTAPVFVLSMFPGLIELAYEEWILLLLSAPVVLVAGAPFFVDAARVLRAGSANMNTLIALGVSVSFVYSVVATVAPDLVSSATGAVHVYYEAAAVITTLVLLGRMLEAKARARTDAAIRKLIELQPDVALVVRNGEEARVPVAEVELGERIILRPGSRVPVDGVVTDGESDIDESMLTGEPMPVEKHPGSEVSSGTINLTGSVHFEATRIGSDTALQRIIQLVRSAQGRKPPIQRLADRVAGVFVPAVLIAALVTFAVWMLVGPTPPLRFAMLTAVSVLIIACPCALGLATPTAVLVGIGRAATSGIFIKGGDALERLSKVDAVILDKTGTLTEGAPEVVSVDSGTLDETSLLSIAAGIERNSEHPIGKAIFAFATGRGVRARNADRFAAHVGGGVSGAVDGRPVRIGSAAFVRPDLHDDAELQISSNGRTPGRSTVFVTVDGRLAGSIQISDRIRDTSREAVERLHAMGIEVVMATGDNEDSARYVAEQIGIDDIRGGLKPEDKVSVVEELKAAGRKVAVVGDGINDAPALAAADVGIAIGTGTDVAIETADISLVRDDVRSAAEAIDISRQTMRTIRQNLFFAFIYNVIGIPIAAGVLYPIMGILLNPMIASGAMAMSSVSVVGNSLRLKK